MILGEIKSNFWNSIKNFRSREIWKFADTWEALGDISSKFIFTHIVNQCRLYISEAYIRLVLCNPWSKIIPTHHVLSSLVKHIEWVSNINVRQWFHKAKSVSRLITTICDNNFQYTFIFGKPFDQPAMIIYGRFLHFNTSTVLNGLCRFNIWNCHI